MRGFSFCAKINLMKIKIGWQNPIIIVLGILVVFGAGVVARQYNIIHFGAVCDLSKYRYINAELRCKSKQIVDKRGYIELKQDLLKFIQEKKKENVITDVSIYFRDLQNGPTLGIDEYSQFSPASLLKLPLLLAYYNLRENQPDLFEKQLIIKNLEKELTQSILPKESIQLNKTYSINDLLNYMIRYSDNQSYYVLLDYLHQISPEKDLLKETFDDLGIIDPKDFLDNTISVKSYGSIFVQLFNTSYFSQKETSESALNLLIESDWRKGINAGVPVEIEVAHKFGEREDFAGGVIQLHDCGIVYYPENPYLLCVMTRGYDLDKLAETIASISKMFYEEFDSRKL